MYSEWLDTYSGAEYLVRVWGLGSTLAYPSVGGLGFSKLIVESRAKVWWCAAGTPFECVQMLGFRVQGCQGYGQVSGFRRKGVGCVRRPSKPHASTCAGEN